MSKTILRVVLTVSAVVFALNLLLFSYGRNVALPLLGALFLLAVCIGLGDALAAVLQVSDAGILTKSGLGWMAVTACFYLLCFFRMLNALAILLFFAVSLAVLGWRFFLRAGKEESRQSLRAFFSRPLSEYAVFLLPLVYAALPATFYDSLVYHLGIPNLYLQHGGFIPTPQFVYANTFIYYEISLIPAVFLGDMVPRLFHFLLGTIFLVAVSDEAAEQWGVKSRAALVLALVSLPMSLFLLATCKNDLVGALFIFLAISRFRRGDWKLSALFWGFAVGIKYFNLLPLVVFMLIAFKPWKKADLRKLVITGLIVFLSVSPLLVKNYQFSKNPFSPFLTGLFSSEYWDGARYAFLRADVGRMYDSVTQFLKFPYDLSFSEEGSGGIVGPLFIIFLPFLLLTPRIKKDWLIFSLMVLMATPFFSGSLRFAYIVFVILTIYVLLAFEAASKPLLKCVFYTVLVVNFFMGAALLERIYSSHLLWSGKRSPEEYKEVHFPAYPLYAYINANIPSYKKILVAGEARNFYLKRPYQVSSALDYGILKKYLHKAMDAQQFITAMRDDGFSYLAINFFELQRLKGYANYTPAEEVKLLGFFQSLVPMFRQGPLCLFKIG